MSKFEKQLKKTLKSELIDTQPTTQLKSRIYNENDINLPKPFSFKFKWSYACIFILTMMCTSLLIINILHNNEPTIINNNDSYLALVTIDVNPSIEMVVDEKNQVLSVYGNNDEGKMIIEGENIIGQNLEEVINAIIFLEKDIKYLVSGLSNEITISITTDEQTKNEMLTKSVKQMVVDSCQNNDLEANVNVLDGKSYKELKNQVLQFNPILNDDKIKNYTLTDLINEVKLYQLEVKNFATTKIEKLYLEIKKQSITLTEQESIRNAINNLDKKLYNNEIDEYNEKYDLFIYLYNLVQETFEKYFILDDSLYQNMLYNLEKNKNELNKQKKLAGEKYLENDLVGYFNANIAVITLITICDELEKTLITIEEEAYKIYDEVCNKLTKAIEDLNDCVKKFYTNIVPYKFNNIKETANDIYDYKNQLLQNFEIKYKQDIEKQKNKVIEFKQTLRTN